MKISKPPKKLKGTADQRQENRWKLAKEEEKGKKKSKREQRCLQVAVGLDKRVGRREEISKQG